MGNLKTILGFGWKYLRPYWRRLVMAIVLSCVCGLTAGAFLWATNTFAKRMQGPAATAEAEAAKQKSKRPKVSLLPGLEARAKQWQKSMESTLDPWLPRTGVQINMQQVMGGLLLLPLIALLRGGTDYLSNYCMNWVSERVINDLRCEVMGKLTSLSLDYFNRSTTGDMLTRINVDTVNLHRALRQAGADVFKESFTMLAALAGLWWVDWKLALFLGVLLPIIALPLFILGRKARRAGREGRRANVGQSSLLVEALSGIRVLKAFNLENRQTERFREFSKKLVHHSMKGVQAKEMANPIIEVIAAVGVGAIIVYLFWSGQSPADLFTLITALLFFFTPVKKLAGVHIFFEQAAAGVERLMELMREKPSVVDPVSPKPLKNFERDIVFENVDFTYGKNPVLRGVNLRIPRGFKLGIAGESGCGKSTLVNLLFRFYDSTSGAVKIDGVNVRDMSFEDLRRPMALVSQDVFVFRTSIAENIAAGKLNATREEIEAAGRAANAHEFIMQLPEGYDTVIGERGMTLSGGQRARLAIARAFVRNAPILVLDEATASLDSKAEVEVQAEIDRLEENRTVISIAHRLSTLANMDEIIVLAQGQIVEQGKFDDLLRAKGIFAAMAARQGIFATT